MQVKMVPLVVMAFAAGAHGAWRQELALPAHPHRTETAACTGRGNVLQRCRTLRALEMGLTARALCRRPGHGLRHG